MTQQTLTQPVSDDVKLQVWIPVEMKEKLRHLQYTRNTTYRELVLEALESTYGQAPTPVKKRT